MSSRLFKAEVHPDYTGPGIQKGWGGGFYLGLHPDTVHTAWATHLTASHFPRAPRHAACPSGPGRAGGGEEMEAFPWAWPWADH